MGSDLLESFHRSLGWGQQAQPARVSTQMGTDPPDYHPPAPETPPASTLLGGAAGGFGANVNVSGSGFQGSTTGYRAAGGGVSSIENGYSANAGFVPYGLANTSLGFDRNGRSGSLTAGDAYFGRQEVGGNVTNTNGVYAANGTYSSGYGVENVNARLQGPGGTVAAHVGEYSRGDDYRGGVRYDSNTGVVGANLGRGGPMAQDVQVGYQSANGRGAVTGSVGSFSMSDELEGDVSAQYDPRTHTASATGHGTIGGMDARDVTVGGRYGNNSVNLHAGEISNNTQISNASASIGPTQARVQADYDGGGVRMNNFDGQTSLGGGAVTAQSHIGSLSTTNSITGGFAEANYGANPNLRVGAHDVSWGGLSGSDLGVNVQGPGGSNFGAHAGSFGDGLEMHDASMQLDRNGLQANVGSADYSNFRASNLDLSGGTADVNARAHVGQLNLNQATIQGGHAELDSSHLGVSAREAGYQTVGLRDVSASGHVDGVYDAQASLGEGHYNAFHGENVNARLDRNGLSASADNASYSWLGGRDIQMSNSIGDGAITSSLGAGSASVGGVNAGHLAYDTNLRNSNLSATDLSAHGLRTTDLHASQTIGDVGANVDARVANALDLQVGQLDAHSRNFGTAGDAHVQNANLDLLNIQGGHAGLSVGGQEMVGARGDVRTGGSVADARGEYDLRRGTASGQFRDAHLGAQMNNASVNLFGNNIALPNAGVDVRASGSGSVDARHGRAEGNVSLGGSSVNVGGTRLTVPEFVQANGGIDASRGAAHAQVGGANGVGGRMDLSRGQLEVNAFGAHVDVASNLRSARDGIGSMATGVGNMASSAWNSLPSMPHISMPHLW